MLDIDVTPTRKIVKYIQGSKVEQTRSNPGTFSLRNSSIVTTLHFTRVTPDPCDLSSPSLFFSPTWYVVCVFTPGTRLFHAFPLIHRETRGKKQRRSYSQPRWRLLRQRSAAQSRTWHGFFLRRRFTHRDQAWICYSRDSRGSNGDLKCPWSLSRRETRTKALNLSSLRLQFLLDEFFSLKHIGHLFHPIPYLLFLPA